MKIETLYISDFGKIHNRKIDLDKGLNIIFGENESGKSTLCAFIKFIFYGLYGKTGEKLHYISWQSSSASGYAVVSDENKRYRIEREAICVSSADGKTSLREKCLITDLLTGAAVFQGKNAGEIFFGVPADVFESTVFVGQLEDSRIGGRSLAEATENILFSGDESINTQKAMKKLDDARVFLLHKNRHGGKIAELTARKEELEAQLEEAKKASGDVISLEWMCRSLGGKVEKEKQRLADCDQKLELFEKYSLRRLYLKRRAEDKHKKELEDECEKISLADGFGGKKVYEDEYIASLEALTRSIDSASARYEAAKAEKAKSAGKMKEFNEKMEIFRKFGKKTEKRDAVVKGIISSRNSAKKLGTASLICFPLGIALIICAVLCLTAVLPEILMIPFAVAGGVGVLAALMTFLLKSGKKSNMLRLCGLFGCKSYKDFDALYRAAVKEEPMLEYIESEKIKAEKAEADAENALTLAKEHSAKVLAEAGFEVGENIRDSISAAIEICRAEKEKLGKVLLLLSEQEKKLDDIDDRLRAYDDDFLRSAISAEYDEAQIAAMDIKNIKKNRDFLQGSITAMNEKFTESEKKLAVLSATSVSPDEISEELTGVSREIDVLTEKFNAYVLALESLEKAGENLRSGVSPKIAKTASGLMSKFSLGKYRTVGVDEEFLMTYTDGASTHSADALSAGTSDLMYISLRLALIDILYETNIPPMIFDESFSRIDSTRLSSALSLLNEICKSGVQGLIFTCHGREEAAMREIGGCNVIYLS